MKASDLRKKKSADLGKELVNLRKEQFNLRMQGATGMTKPGDMKRVRRDIARVKTVLNEKRGEQ